MTLTTLRSTVTRGSNDVGVSTPGKRAEGDGEYGIAEPRLRLDKVRRGAEDVDVVQVSPTVQGPCSGRSGRRGGRPPRPSNRTRVPGRRPADRRGARAAEVAPSYLLSLDVDNLLCKVRLPGHAGAVVPPTSLRSSRQSESIQRDFCCLRLPSLDAEVSRGDYKGVGPRVQVKLGKLHQINRHPIRPIRTASSRSLPSVNNRQILDRQVRLRVVAWP